MTRSRVCQGFTLVELLVAIGLLALVLVLLATMTNSTESSWRATSGKIEQFRDASNAFESVTRRLSQATLNTYWDYDSPTTPTKYIRQSELRFMSGLAVSSSNGNGIFLTSTTTRPTDAIFFQGPLGFVDELPLVNNPNFGGLDNLLNTWGYYVEYNQDIRPAFVNNLPNPPPVRNRYRLMEVMEPSNQMTIYNYTSGPVITSTGANPSYGRNLFYITNPALNGLNSSVPPTGVQSAVSYTGREWFMDALNTTRPPVHVLAENIIALVLLPKFSQQDETYYQTSGQIPQVPIGTSLAPTYNYDSTAYNSNPVLNSQNQLPPVVQATMVAIDEVSAGRMKAADVTNLNAELAGLFSQSANFNTDLRLNTTNPNNLENYHSRPIVGKEKGLA